MTKIFAVFWKVGWLAGGRSCKNFGVNAEFEKTRQSIAFPQKISLLTSKNTQTGLCRSFHRDRRCSLGIRCKFSHKCFNCGLNHSFSSCMRPIFRPFRYQPFQRQFQQRTQMRNTPGTSQIGSGNSKPLSNMPAPKPR